VSKLETDFRNRLSELYAVKGEAVVSHDYIHVADIELQNRVNGRRLIIECDGIGHFIGDDSQDTWMFNGSTLLQSHLINKVCEDAVLLRITSPAIMMLLNMGDDNFKQHISDLIDYMGTVEPATYVLDRSPSNSTQFVGKRLDQQYAHFKTQKAPSDPSVDRQGYACGNGVLPDPHSDLC
jgi:hypothetical protein